MISVEGTRDALADCVQKTHPEVYVGHSLGGLLLPKLLVAKRILQPSTLIVDTLFTELLEMFRNFVR